MRTAYNPVHIWSLVNQCQWSIKWRNFSTWYHRFLLFLFFGSKLLCCQFIENLTFIVIDIVDKIFIDGDIFKFYEEQPIYYDQFLVVCVMTEDWGLIWSTTELFSGGPDTAGLPDHGHQEAQSLLPLLVVLQVSGWKSERKSARSLPSIWSIHNLDHCCKSPYM